jgi:hypothetical protein
MVWIINGAVMVISGFSFLIMAERDRSWNGRLCVGVSWIWMALGIFVIGCGVVQIFRLWF